MKVLELFSGTESISKQFRNRGHETYTIDNNPVFDSLTSWQANILNVTSDDIIERFGKPDLIWASIPCTWMSVASIGRNWDKIDGVLKPKSEGALLSYKLIDKVMELVNDLQPMYWFMENPRGAMRKTPQVNNLPMYTVTYCQYGDTRMKPTDLWTNHLNPKFKPPCKNGMPCHVAAPRGSKTGTQGMKNAIDRSIIPSDLCRHIVDICEG